MLGQSSLYEITLSRRPNIEADEVSAFLKSNFRSTIKETLFDFYAPPRFKTIACIFAKRTRNYYKIKNFYKDMKIIGTVFVDYSFYLYTFTQTRTGIAPP